MTRHPAATRVNAQFALEGDHAAARQALADFHRIVTDHFRTQQPGKLLGPVEIDPALAYHLARTFERILSGERPDKTLGIAFERGRRKNKDSTRLAQRDTEIEAAFWYLTASGVPRAEAIRSTAEIVGLTERQTNRKVSGQTVSEARFLATLAEGPRDERLARLAELTGPYRSKLAALVQTPAPGRHRSTVKR